MLNNIDNVNNNGNNDNKKLDKHVIVSDDAHNLIMRKQAEFLLRGIRKPMQEIANMAIMEGIDKIKVE
ncbi:MAG: hypothetical protein PHP08_00505 [Candidatus Dojkabacteria bacterium]|nr:hypothetical protein [Candidatus Dojkabacteria bacterium]